MLALVLGINKIFCFIGNFKFIFTDSVVVTKLWKYHNELLNKQFVHALNLPKFLSPLKSSNMNTPICIKPRRAGKRRKKKNDIFTTTSFLHVKAI